jgi:HSP20 family protein
MSSRWEPFDQLTSLREAMSRLMDQSFTFHGRGGDASAQNAQSVPVNIFESGDVLMVTAAMPGVQEEDIEVTARGNMLTVEARERADLKPDETGKRYLRHEWRYGPYRRMVELPYAVDANSAEATLGDGVLTVRLNKAATERTHKINVNTVRPR